MKILTSERKGLDRMIMKFSTYPIIELLLIALILNISYTLLFSNLFANSFTNAPKYDSLTEAFFLAVIFGPIIETLLFQSFIIKYSLKFFQNDKLIAILLSATLFGVAHTYSVPYMAKAFISGLLYAFLFFIFLHKERNPVIYITILHATFNAIVVTTNYLSDQ